MKQLLGLTALALALTACGGSPSGGNTDQVGTTPPPSSAPAASAAGCQSPPSAKPSQEQFSSEPKLTITRTNYTAHIVTNCGTIVVTLDGKNAPHTINSFAFLAGKHFFDNSPCHRLTTSGLFVLQCGDPTGTGGGGPGYSFGVENAPADGKYPAGTVAMARTSDPNTNGSQFFLVYKDTTLPEAGGAGYTIFGTITKGLDIVSKVADAGTDSASGDGAPKQKVTIESVTIGKS